MNENNFDDDITQLAIAVGGLAASLGVSHSIFIGGRNRTGEESEVIIGDLGGMPFYLILNDVRGILAYYYHNRQSNMHPFAPVLFTTIRHIDPPVMVVGSKEELLCKLTVHYKLREKHLKLYERFVTQEDKNADC